MAVEIVYLKGGGKSFQSCKLPLPNIFNSRGGRGIAE